VGITPLKNKSNLQRSPGSPKRVRSEGVGTLKKKKTFGRSPFSELKGNNVDNLRRAPGIQRYGGKKSRKPII